MSRVPVVTRTIKTNKVNYLALDMSTHEVSTQSAFIPSSIHEKAKMLKYLISEYESKVENGENVPKPVEVINIETIETLRGMSESDFIKYSHEITRNKKSENNTENEATEG